MADEGDFKAKLRQMSKRFLARSRSEAEQLETYIQDPSPENVAAIRKVAHGLAGAGETFGFPEISRLALSLEAAAEANSHDRIAELGRTLITEIRQQGGGA